MIFQYFQHDNISDVTLPTYLYCWYFWHISVDDICSYVPVHTKISKILMVNNKIVRGGNHPTPVRKPCSRN